MTKRKLTYENAIDIWLRRWLGHERHAIIRDFDQNPIRIYEIWQEEAFPGSREDAEITFRTRHPDLAKTVDFSPHKKTRKLVSRRSADPQEDRQGQLF